jgi:hypothetical protein
MYAGVNKALRLHAEREPGQRKILIAFLEDMHALKYIEDKVRDIIENEDKNEEGVGEI